MPLFKKPEVTIDALRSVVGLIRTVASKIGGLAGSVSNTSDRTCDRVSGLDVMPSLVRGYVVRSGIGSYDCEVLIGGGKVLACSVLAPVLHQTYGVSQSCIPVPGANVLVFVPSVGLSGQRTNYGIVIGVIPEDTSHGLSKDGAGINKVSASEYPEGGVAQFTEDGPGTIASDASYPAKGEYQCSRPYDVVPGEFVLTNHNGSGLVIGAVSSSIKGSESASVRCSALDDQVRIVSGHFRHISSAGSEEIYDDGGFISVESSVSMYKAERLGMKSEGSPAFTHTPSGLTSRMERTSGVLAKAARQTAKKRIYRYEGYLGDVINMFVASPSPDEDVCDMTSDSVDQGLFHAHVDSSGRFSVRSAGGVFLERFDRIPVPKRKHYAWDPDGDHAAESSPEAKGTFTLSDSANNQMAIGLTLGDMSAWWNNLAYLRFRQFSKDFVVRDQKDLKCPNDMYDEIGKGKESFSENDLKHSYIGLTPNGGIVLRDAWGSELVMADGRITLNAAANIEIRSGSSVVVMGGDDVIAKAYNSMDLSSTQKDVRIKAENNLQMVSASRGVLIQSKAASGAQWDKKGEDVVSTGVVIKADKSSVAIVGENAEIQGRSSVSLSSFKESKPNGNIVISGKQMSVAVDGSAVITAKGKSGVIVSEQSAVLCAPSALLIGGRSEGQTAGDKFIIGIPVDFDSIYSEIVSICKNISQVYLESTEWLSPFEPTVFSEITFRFRTSDQYGTEGAGSGLTKGGVFSVYEPSWAAMTEAGMAIMSGCSLGSWEERPDDDGEYPWPGKKAMGKCYCTYKQQNIKKSGVESPESASASIDRQDFSKYHIRENI